MSRRTRIGALALAGVAVLGGLLGGCSKSARRARDLAQAQRDFKAGNYDAAELELRNVLQADRGETTAIRDLGLIYSEEGRLQAAYPFLARAARDFPADDLVALRFAELQALAGQRAEARDAARKLVVKDGSNQLAIALLLQASASDADLKDTRSLIESGAKGGDTAATHVGRGLLALRDRKREAARQEFAQAARLDPASRVAWSELAVLALAGGDRKTAGEDFQKAADAAPLRSPERVRLLEFEAASGNKEEAARHLADLIAKAPDFIPARALQMKVAAADRRYDEALKDAEAVLSRDPRNRDALLLRGVIHLAKDDVKGALAALDVAEKQLPRSPEVAFQQGQANTRAGEITHAITEYRRALSLAPNYEAAAQALARAEAGRGDVSAAARVLSPFVAKGAATAPSYRLLGQALEAQQDLDGAAATYEQARKRFPNEPEFAYRLGSVLRRKGKTEEARTVLNEAVRMKPDYGPANEALLDADIAARRFDAAQARIAKLEKDLPGSTMPLLLDGKLRIAQQDLAGAEAPLRKAEALDPKSDTASLVLAEVQTAEKRTDAAIRTLQALAGRMKSPSALMQLGILYTRDKRYTDARDAYERLLAIAPEAPGALNNLALLYLDNLGQPEKAEQLAQRAADLRPSQPGIMDSLGWIQFRRGQAHKAVALVESAAQKSPADPEIQYHVGVIRYTLGDEKPAHAALVRALEGSKLPPDMRDDAVRRLAILDSGADNAGAAARANLEAAVKKDPGDLIAKLRLGQALEQAGQPKEAAAQFEAVLKASPDNLGATVALVRLCAGPLNDPGRARTLARAAHQQAPDDYSISWALGKLLRGTQDYPWSATLIEEAHRHLPDDPGLTFDYAEALYDAGRVRDASDTLSDLLQGSNALKVRGDAARLAALCAATLDHSLAPAKEADAARLLAAQPRAPAGLMVRALAEQAGGKYDEAGRDYETLLAEDPGFGPAVRELSLLYLQRLSNDQKAYDLALRAKPLFPDDPQIDQVIGIVLYRRGDYAGAIKSLQTAQRKAPQVAESLFYLGLCHFRTNEPTLAQAELERAVALHLPTEQNDDAHRVLDQIASVHSAN